MSWHKLSPAILTLLVFLLAQGLGTVLLIATGLLSLPDLVVSLNSPRLALIMMVVDIFAVLACYFLLHSIRPVTTSDFSSINWRPGMLGIAGGLLGAMSISVLTDNMELPEVMQQMSLAMSHSVWGLLLLVVVGPVSEELLFREAIEGEMLRRGTSSWAAILVSALAFSSMHLNLAQGLFALPLGILFGIVYYKTGNIILTSVLHVINNGVVAAQLYVLGEDMADISYASWLGSPFRAYALMVLSGAFCVILMIKFWKGYAPRVEMKEKEPYTAQNAELQG